MATNLKAAWNIQLITDGPGCNESVDLLDYGDFWDGRDLELGEHLTQPAKTLKWFARTAGMNFTWIWSIEDG